MKMITFKELCIDWLNRRKSHIKESTYSTYLSHLDNHIIPCFGELECSSLTEQDIENTVLKWSEDLSQKTVKDIVMILKSCIKYGNKCGYINFDNMEIMYSSKIQTKRIKSYSADEQRLIINAVLSNLNSRSVGILITLYTGIRIGELCALKWSDIDIENGTINISKTLQRVYLKDNEGIGYTKITISSPKTFSSIREIPISSDLISIIKRMYNKSKDTYVLTSDNKYMEPRTYRSYYNKFIKGLNINCLNFHSLRHTFATGCIESGADYKTVSELLGHSTINMTLNLYVHPSMEQKRRCVDMIGKVLEQGKGTERMVI